MRNLGPAFKLKQIIEQKKYKGIIGRAKDSEDFADLLQSLNYVFKFGRYEE